jgi:F-type H+-transporting ATPase subunit gamma
LRRKISAFKNTQKITKAMKMVAAAKLKRSQDRILSARPYALKMRGVLSNLSRRVYRAAHPLLQKREGKKVEILVVTSDRALRRLQRQYRPEELRVRPPVRSAACK